MNEPPDFPDWLQTEIERERARVQAPSSAKARVREALALRLAMTEPGATHDTPPSESAGGASTSRVARWTAGAWTVGLACGVIATKLFWPTVQQRPAATAPVVAVPSSVVDLPTPPSPSAQPPPPPPSVTAKPSTSPSAPAPRNTEEEERRLLDEARLALARGDYAEALAGAERHGKKFPRGTLVEEREALAIKALARQGDTTSARQRYAAFVARFHNSPQRAALASELPGE